MVKDKLEKSCADSAAVSIKEEPTEPRPDKEAASGTEPVIPKKEEDVAATGASKESPGSRGSNSGSRPSSSCNANTATTNGSTTGAPPTSGNTPLCADATDVSSILDSASDVPSVPDDAVLGERVAPLPADLQPDSFGDAMRAPPIMQQVRPSPNGVPLKGGQPQPTGGMEVQYMQQQSQIFVFSTMLANKSAEAVFQGHFQSIIAYHCAQPGTKKYFEKYPLKLAQFHRQSPAQWLNGLAMMKNKGCGRGPNMPPGMPNFPPKPVGPMGMVDSFPSHDGIVDDITPLHDSDVPWEQRPPANHPMGMTVGAPNAGNNEPNAVPLPEPSLDPDACLGGGGPPQSAAPPGLMLGHSPCISNTAPTSPSLSSLEPSLQGVKVPDEDLTPQQRQHREEQLATLRKMQQMLFPEENTNAMGMPDEHEMTGGGNPGEVGAMPPGLPAHLDWPKLQNQMFDGKMKGDGPPTLRGMPPGLAQTTGAVLSPQVPGGGPGPRLQGPPPPYHQTPRSASVPIALQSPSPASPNNPTSNLSLPSPRTSSALNSPADSRPQQPPFSGLGRHFTSTQQSPTSQSSPGAATTASTRPVASNPGTPLAAHFSPSAPSSADPLPAGEFPANGPASGSQHHGVDGMFCRTLQSMAQKQHMVSGVAPGATDISGSPSKEPNLMPVPSPQQIQYCNTFEGQELTIQKQPNTSLKDRSITSPVSLDSGFPGEVCSASGNSTRVSAPNTPLTPVSVDMGPRFSNATSDCYRLPVPSPSSIDTKNPRPSPQSGPVGGQTPGRPVDKDTRFSNSSPLDGHNRYPPMMGGSVSGSPNPFSAQQQQAGGKPQTSGGPMMAVSPPGNKPNDGPPISSNGPRADNVPLNPNSNNGLPGNPKGSHFDPISSLAQMSQLLTSTSTLNGQSGGGGGGPSMMPYGGVNTSAMDMGRPDMGGCVPDMDGGMMGMPGGPHVYNAPGMGSPKNMPFMPPQRIMRPNMGQGPMPPYNGTNVQVKASAPNTIQYLPARPQMGPSNPRGPPSLDFLRFANPNMDAGKVGGPPQNMQYFGGCGPNQNMAGHMDGGPMHNDGLMSIMNGPAMMAKMGGGMPAGGMVGPQGMMPLGMGMRGAGGLRPSMRMHGGPMVSGGPFEPDAGAMYGGQGGGPQMFGPGGKGPMGRGMCAPDASQPLPPSVGQANAYKSSPFGGGATTADPNYAQQFHNFQQQLYATSTRSQLTSQGPGPPQPGAPPGPPPTNAHMYFMSK